MAGSSASSQAQVPWHDNGNASVDTHKDAGIPENKEENLKEWYIGSIDQGTTSSRFLIFDGTGTPVASHQVEFKQMYPQSG